MSSEKKAYSKSLEDEIDWKIIDQLHTVTTNFSTTSLELKKLFIVLVGVAVPLLIKLANDKLDLSLFITIYILNATFWFLDSYTYFYQEKLREKMDRHFDKIKNRNSEISSEVIEIDNEFTLENDRKSNSRLRRSAINRSVILYMMILISNTLGLVLYLIGVIE